MSSIKTLKAIKVIFQDIADRSYHLKGSFGYGKTYDYGMSNKDMSYPTLWVTPVSAVMNKSEATTRYVTIDYTFNVKCLDRVRKDMVNKVDVDSDTLTLLAQIITEFNDHPYYTRSDMSLVGNINFTPLEAFSNDQVSGHECQMTFRMINKNSYCGLPFEAIPGVSFPGPEFTGYTYTPQFLTCATVTGCTTLQDYISNEISENVLDIEFPLAIVSGGTGVDSAVRARYNLGINSTAVYSGCVISGIGSSTFDVSPGKCFISTIGLNDEPTYIEIDFSGVTGVTPAYGRPKLYIDSGGTLNQFDSLLQEFPIEDRKNNVFLGTIAYFSATTTIIALQNTPSITLNTSSRLEDLSSSIGPLNLTGNIIAPNGSNLLINKSQGTTYRIASNLENGKDIPDITNDPVQIPTTGETLIAYRNGIGGFTYIPYSGITPNVWDDGSGTPATVSNNRWTIQRVYFYNTTNTFLIYLGQTQYNSQDAAIAGVNTENRVLDSVTAPATYRCGIVVKKGTTALNSSTTTFVEASKFFGAGSGGIFTTINLQGAYDNSVTPEIITNSTNGALTIQGHSGGTENIFEGRESGSTTTSFIKANGNASFNVITATGVTTNYVDFNTAATESNAIGRFVWNDTDGTLDLGLKGGSVDVQVGQQMFVRAVNKTGADLLAEDYAVVYISGAQGNRVKINLAQGNTHTPARNTIGLVTEDIADNQEGFITTFGLVRDINTTGTIQGETWNDGDTLYLSNLVNGGLTNIQTSGSAHTAQIGYVVRAHATQGSIFVKVSSMGELDDLHDVVISSGITGGSMLEYHSSSDHWFDAPIKWTVELVDAQTVDVYAPYALAINSIENVLNSPSISIQDDGAAYTLGNTIAIGSKISVSASTASVINLTISK